MSDSGMGRALSVHRGTFGAGGWLWYIGGVLVLSGVFNTVQGVRAMLGAAVDVGGQSGMDIVLMGGASFFIAALVLILPVLRWQQRLEIFEGGLVASRLYGTRTIARGDVRGAELIAHRSRMGQHVEVVVNLRDGSSFSMSGLERPEEAANLVGSLAHAPATSADSTKPGGWRPPGAIGGE